MATTATLSGTAPVGYRFAPVPGAPSGPSVLAAPGGVGADAFTPLGAAQQSQQTFTAGMGGLEAILATMGGLLQQITAGMGNVQGFTNLDEQKQEAAQTIAGGTQSAEQALADVMNSLGQAPGVGTAQAIGQVRSEGARGLQSALTDINTRNQTMQSEKFAQLLTAMQNLLAQIGNVGVARADIGQRQQFPVLSQQAASRASGGGGTVMGPQIATQPGTVSNQLRLTGPDAARFTQLSSVPFGSLAGSERMELMRLRSLAGY